MAPMRALGAAIIGEIAIGRAFLPDVEAEGARADGPTDPGDLQKSNLFFRQPFSLIFRVPAQAGYGDKWPS
jgi:hypothetical protein